MSDAIYTSDLPTDADIYVGEVDSAVKNQKGTGINFKGVTVKDHEGQVIKKGNLFLFDSVLKDRDGKMQAITSVFMLSARYSENHSKHFWNYSPIDKTGAGQTTVIDIQEAPAPRSGGGGGGSDHPWTPKELEACYDYWLVFMEQKYGAIDKSPMTPESLRLNNLQAIAYAVDGMVEISSMACKPEHFTGETPMESSEPAKQEVSDDDIPF